MHIKASKFLNLRTATYILTVCGILLNLLFIVPNGNYECIRGVCGVTIGEWHYHDALWHIAVARNSFSSFPFLFPSASNFTLTSYNYLLGLILHILEYVQISSFFSYFKLLPVIGNIALVYTLYRYLRLTGKSDIQRFWTILFTYFGTSFSYVLIFYQRSLLDYSILKGFPVVSTLQPSFVLSNVQFFLTISLWLYIFTDIITKKHTLKNTLLHAILLAFAIGLKIYVGLFTYLLLVIGNITYGLVQQRFRLRTTAQVLILTCVFILSVIIFYLPFSTYSSHTMPFVWSLLSIPHSITESTNLLYHKSFTLGRYYLYGVGAFSPRLIAYELISAVIFIFWNLGTRCIAIAYLIWSLLKRRLSYEVILLSGVSIIGLCIPLFFIQAGGGWYNSIQFAYISMYTWGILAAYTMTTFFSKRSVITVLITILIVVFTLPNTIFSLKFIFKEKIMIENGETKALSYLSRLPKGVVLSLPDSKNSSYVPALSSKINYVIDYEQGELLSLPVQSRIKKVKERNCDILSEVDYLYLNSPTIGREFVQCPSFASQFQRKYIDANIVIYQRKTLLP